MPMTFTPAPKIPALTKLNRAAHRAQISNAIDLQELGGVTSSPTGSQVQVTFPTTAPTGGRFYGAANAGQPNVDSWCNFYGTPKVFGGLADHVQSQHATTPSGTSAAGANISQTVSGTTSLTAGKGSMFGVEFMTDSLSLTLKILAGGGSPYFRVLVDGQYVTKTPGTLTTIPSNRFVNLTFGTRRTRRIKLEIEQDATFDGAYVSALESVYRLDHNQLVRAGLLLDSYGTTTTGSPASPMWDGPMGVLAKLMGWDDVRNASIAGTGWVNAGASWPFGSHVADLPQGCDVIVLGGCFNDNGLSGSLIRSAVQQGLQTVRAQHPGTPIIMLGVWSPPVASVAALQAAEAAQLAGYQAASDALTAFIPLTSRTPTPGLPNSQSIYFGTGNDSATTGDGNADLYIKGDATHPNLMGYDFTARYLANLIRGALMAMAVS